MQLKLLNNEIVQDIYARFVVKSDSYFDRFKRLEMAFRAEELAAYGAMDPPRVVSLVDFKEWIVKYGIVAGDSLLSTFPSDPEIQYLNYSSMSVLQYPPHDLHTFNLSKKDHDFAVFNQTIEHLHTPILALHRIREHLRDGGFVYTTVPTVNIPHMTPIHFNGYTPTGLCALMISCGFDICECGYWGNYKYIEYIFKHGEWCNYSQVLDEAGVLTYDPTCQAQTWVLARKA